MSFQTRRRVFGVKAQALPEAHARALTPAELRHSTTKLIAWTLVCAVFMIFSIGTVLSGGLGADYHGRDAGLIHLLGPQGTVVLFAAFGIGCAVLDVAYLRLLADASRTAVSATSNGLSINGVWGRKAYAWRDVVSIRLHITRARSKEIAFIKVERFDGGSQMVSANTIEGGRTSVEAWIAQAQSFLHR